MIYFVWFIGIVKFLFIIGKVMFIIFLFNVDMNVNKYIVINIY